MGNIISHEGELGVGKSQTQPTRSRTAPQDRRIQPQRQSKGAANHFLTERSTSPESKADKKMSKKSKYSVSSANNFRPPNNNDEMGNQLKRKKIEGQEFAYICSCYTVRHPTQYACQRAAKLSEHIDISTSLIIGSKSSMSNAILIGPYKDEPRHEFMVHSELLALHSSFFKNMLFPVEEEPGDTIEVDVEGEPDIDSNDPPEEDSSSPTTRTVKVEVEESHDVASVKGIGLSPGGFACFISWIYTGMLIPSTSCLAANGQDCVDLWLLGHKLGSPSFQNHIIEELRSNCFAQVNQYPTPSFVRRIYELTGQLDADARTGCRLRKLFANILAADHPLQKYHIASNIYQEWLQLLQMPDLSIEVHAAMSAYWQASKPWGDENAAMYLVAERPLRERLIEVVGEADGAELRVKAHGGCVKSKLLLKHVSPVF